MFRRSPASLMAIAGLIALGASVMPHNGTIAPPPRLRPSEPGGPLPLPPDSKERLSKAEEKRARKMAKRAAHEARFK